MRYQGFCGPSNQSQSVIANCERLVNWRYERIQSPFAPVEAALYPTPGRQAYAEVSAIGSREYFVAEGRFFAVIGGGLYEVDGTAGTTLLGAVAQDGNPAQMAYLNASGGQLCIASGTNTYHYNLTTGVFQQVLTGETTMIGAIDGRFLSFNRVTGQVRLSASNDGTTWTAQAFARSAAPDRWQAMVIGIGEIWMIGEETGEVWYNSGASPQPFALNRGSLFQYGTIAPFSARKVGDSIVWVSSSKDGAGRIIRARGYTPQPISTYAVETALGGYARASTIGDAETLSYELEGHLMAVFSFPSGPGTWAVDMETGSWVELGSWNAPLNRFDAWAPRVHAYCFNKHFVGDRATGIIAELDTAFGDDLGATIRRLRVGPPIMASSRQRIVVSRFEVLLEAGLGTATGQGVDPQVMLRTSYDAKRWSAERMASAGRMGQYQARCVFTRAGSSETLWVPEVSVSDPIPWRLTGAEIDGLGISQRRAA